LRQFGPKRLQIAASWVHPNQIATMTTTTSAADPYAPIWAESARIYDLRRAMCAWRTQRRPSPQRVRIPGPRRLRRRLARRDRQGAPRAQGHCRSLLQRGTRPPPRRAALPQAKWRSGRQDAPQGARAPRVAAQRRAHAAQLGTVALRRPHCAPILLVIEFGLSPHSVQCAARALRPFFDNLAKSSGARAFTKGSHLGPAAPKAPTLFR
jgi:hypothetical protein